MDSFSDTILEALKALAQSEVGTLFSLLWAWTLGGIINVILLGQHYRILNTEMRELRDMRHDIMRDVMNKEKEGCFLTRTHQVEGWLERVDSLQLQIEEFRASFNARITFFQQPSCRTMVSTFLLGFQVAKILKRVHKLKNQRNTLIDLVKQVIQPEKVELIPDSTVSVQGREVTLSTIQSYLEDDSSGIVGIYGMPGVGKTTILREINNRLHGSETRFDVVIFVVITRDSNALRIQKCIGERLGLFLSSEGDDISIKADEQAKVLSSALSKRKFLLLLDDVHENLKIDKIGIPRPNSRNICKIVLTTQFEEVCNNLISRKVKVDMLDETKSWELFCRILQADDFVSRPSIEPLARAIVSKCGGFPLALVTVGQIMSSKRSLDEWMDAKEQLEASSLEFSDIKDNIFSKLKSRFNNLENDTIRSCFLYCSLYTNDHEIDKEKVVEHWFGEGLLDRKDDDEDDDDIDIDEARRKGYQLISSLQSSCLLDSGNKSWIGERHIKMHDMFREMALWLASGKHDKSDNFFVHNGKSLTKKSKIKRWEKVTRISLMRNISDGLPDRTPNCRHLLTLLIDGSCHHTIKIPDDFLTMMSSLRVLDATKCNIDVVPRSIGSLLALQYLNLSFTIISSLPKEVGNLKQLRLISLHHTFYLSRIPRDAIAVLPKLQKLDLYKSRYIWSLESTEDKSGDLQLNLKDLEALPSLRDLGINVMSLPLLQGLSSSSALSTSVRCLLLESVSDLTVTNISSIIELFEHLNRLELRSCTDCRGEWKISSSKFLLKLKHLRITGILLSGITITGSRRGGWNMQLPLQNLRELEICTCNSLKELLGFSRLPLLEHLKISACNEMEELVQDTSDDQPQTPNTNMDFPSLQQMDLENLLRLKIISSRSLMLPSLKILNVTKCPLLRKLPFGLQSAPVIQEIKGRQEWWDGLEWEDDAIRSKFDPSFIAQD